MKEERGKKKATQHNEIIHSPQKPPNKTCSLELFTCYPITSFHSQASRLVYGRAPWELTEWTQPECSLLKVSRLSLRDARSWIPPTRLSRHTVSTHLSIMTLSFLTSIHSALALGGHFSLEWPPAKMNLFLTQL